jgi:primosomal protein N' (replication factor Y)
VREPATTDPVARVVVDVSLAHLDRPFDYVVPAHLDDTVVAGGRVRVRLAGRLVDGYVLERMAESEHGGTLSYVERAVSAEPVLSRDVAALARAVADRQAGTMADVLRVAVPPRHGVAERQASTPALSPVTRPVAGPWSRYPTGSAFLDALSRGDAPRAVWTALPGDSWTDEIAIAVHTSLAAGRGAIVVVPDRRDADRVDAALTATIGGEHHVILHADIGPAERYRRFLAVSRGAVRVVIGTRPAVFAPVHDLGLLVVWDDGDDTLAEPRAPYSHARDVAVLRSHLSGAAVVIGGFIRTAESQALLESGWARPLAATRAVVQEHAPIVEPTGDDAELARDAAAQSARLPSLAWRRARDALESGAPVLVQVPRRGYVPALACARCRLRAGCPHCSGPLSLSTGHAVAACRWCGRPAGGWRCPECGGAALRAAAVGAGRTAEELGRAFPGVAVRTSSGDHVLSRVTGAVVVVATPGAEPVADGGYGAVLLLDSWALLTRADLRASEQTVRRWFGAAALARPASNGGRVVVVADRGVPAVQALVRWDPAWAAERELADRVELGFPPAVRMADLTGAADDVADLVGSLVLPPGAETLGPVPVDATTVRMVIRVSRADGPSLSAALKAGQGGRSARHDGGAVRVRLDPVEIL